MIYDRHIDNAKELIKRKPFSCQARLNLNTDKTNFFGFTIDDFEIVDYPLEEIKEDNPQLYFELGI